MAVPWPSTAGALLEPVPRCSRVLSKCSICHQGGHVSHRSCIRNRWSAPSSVPTVAIWPTGGANRQVNVWNAHTGEPVHRSLKHGNDFYRLGFSPDGAWLVAGGKVEVRIWDVRSGNAVGSVLRIDNHASEPQFTPDGSRLVTTTVGGRIHIWDWTGAEPALPPFDGGEGNPSTWAAFSPDGQSVAIVGADGCLRSFWNVQTGNPIGELMSVP